MVAFFVLTISLLYSAHAFTARDTQAFIVACGTSGGNKWCTRTFPAFPQTCTRITIDAVETLNTAFTGSGNSGANLLICGTSFCRSQVTTAAGCNYQSCTVPNGPIQIATNTNTKNCRYELTGFNDGSNYACGSNWVNVRVTFACEYPSTSASPTRRPTSPPVAATTSTTTTTTSLATTTTTMTSTTPPQTTTPTNTNTGGGGGSTTSSSSTTRRTQPTNPKTTSTTTAKSSPPGSTRPDTTQNGQAANAGGSLGSTSQSSPQSANTSSILIVVLCVIGVLCIAGFWFRKKIKEMLGITPSDGGGDVARHGLLKKSSDMGDWGTYRPPLEAMRNAESEKYVMERLDQQDAQPPAVKELNGNDHLVFIDHDDTNAGDTSATGEGDTIEHELQSPAVRQHQQGVVFPETPHGARSPSPGVDMLHAGYVNWMCAQGHENVPVALFCNMCGERRPEIVDDGRVSFSQVEGGVRQ